MKNIIKKYDLKKVEDVVVSVIKNELELDSLNLKLTFRELDVDSLSFAEILINIETSFDDELELDEVVLENGSDVSVENFIEYIYKMIP